MLDDNRLRGSARRAAVASARLILRKQVEEAVSCRIRHGGRFSQTPGGSQRAMEPAETPDPTLHSSTSVVRRKLENKHETNAPIVCVKNSADPSKHVHIDPRNKRRPDSPSAGARGLRYKLRYHCQTSLLAIRDAEMLHQAWDIYLLAEARVGEVSATL
ncbi:hypothetical protein Bbelb_439470 [Branchiostoma belcheri]|nr:hypothetical protein Bbelb_439470 [Branchiostoma belcheri]